ncbi:MAG: hypothetical protein AAF990_24440 [Bacteroidota bacterium]
MKKVNLLLGLLGLLFLANCSNDFELVAAGEDTPIVYGLLSRADTAHYIRVERAFIDPEVSALEIAQRPDSLYYENLSVRVERASNPDEFWILQPVDGADEGYPKSGGIFANQPNILYKFKLEPGEELVEKEKYIIKIDRGDGKPTVTGETTILSDMRVSQPATVKPQKWIYGDDINASNPDVSWRFEVEAVFFDLKIRVNVRKINLSDPAASEDQSLIWTIARNITPEDQGDRSRKFRIPAAGMFQFIGSELEADPNVEYEFIGYDYIVEAGGQELKDYINIGLANTGITSSQITTNFTNLSEGLGVFSSRNTVIYEGFGLTSQSLDSLRQGVFTRDLKFR